MTADIRAAFVDILMRQDWMDDKTKKAAKLKVRGSGTIISTMGFDQNTVRDSGRR